MSTSRDEWLKRDLDWTAVSDDDAKAILDLCGCIPTDADEGINPFPQVVETACTVTKSAQWLYRRSRHWQIGTNNEFPSSYLFIREVNKTMQQNDEEEDDDIPADFLRKAQSQPSVVPLLQSRAPIHVGGTPGTGKTAFGLYLLHRLLLKDPDHTFVYRHGDSNPGCFLYKGVSYCHPDVCGLFHDGLWIRVATFGRTKPIWAILDGTEATPIGSTAARLIVLTSPGDQSNSLRQLLKYATDIVNPPWTLAEIETVRPKIYPHLSKDSVSETFKKWGGIPRIIFDYANNISKLSRLKDSIYSSDPFLLFRQAGLAQIDHSNVSGVHFHLIPGQKFDHSDEALSDEVPSDEVSIRFPAFCWATTWLQDQFWDIVKAGQGEQSILQFLLDRNNVPTARALAFEPHVFRTIENSGFSGRVRLLTDDGYKDQRPKWVPQLRRYTFTTFGELPTGDGAHVGIFYVPVQTNHMSVDFYIPEAGMLVQVTVGQKHGVKSNGLDRALESSMFGEWKANHPQEKLRLIFLCDHFNFEQFGKQPYLTTKGLTVKSESVLRDLNNTYDQYSWELDVGKQLEAHIKHRKPTKRLADSWYDPKEKVVATSNIAVGPSTTMGSVRGRGRGGKAMTASRGRGRGGKAIAGSGGVGDPSAAGSMRGRGRDGKK